jgi:hypothetical protein
VAKTCRDIIDDVEKLDTIQDDFIHFQLLRFCHATRVQYINSHIMFSNRCVLQQQHVDCKIADALLKKGTKQHVDGRDTESKDWAHMVLHLSHAEGGFGVTFNDVTLLRILYFILLLHSLWSDLVFSLRNVRSCGCLKMIFGTRPHGHHPRLWSFVTFTPSFLTRSTAKRYVCRLRHTSASNVDVTVIPSQYRVAQQILSHWNPFQDLKLMFAGSRRAEHLSLCSQQSIVTTVEDSVLRTEMTDLESQEEDVPKRILFFKPMSWLGQIRSHRRINLVFIFRYI